MDSAAPSPLKRRSRPTEMIGESLKDVEESPAPQNKDFRENFALLIVLYMLQGVPLGLAGGTLPYLLSA